MTPPHGVSLDYWVAIVVGALAIALNLLAARLRWRRSTVACRSCGRRVKWGALHDCPRRSM